MKRTTLFALALGGVLMVLTGCNTTARDNSGNKTNGDAGDNNTGSNDTTDFTTNESDGFDKILGFDVSKTALSKGNAYRTKKVIDKIKNGDDVYVACLGGSITEGESGQGNVYKDGYAYLFTKQLQETFAAGKSNVKSVVAGVSGTPSPLGLVRYKKDVVDKLGRKPDLLVIEFAVNDWQECTDTGAFEQLIREVLEASEESAVIALYSVASFGNQKGAMSPVASYYKIPEVDMTPAKSVYGYWTGDNLHPSVNGHKIMANSLMYMMNEIDKAATDEKTALPETYKNNVNFSGYTPLLFGDEVNNPDIKDWSIGSFSDTDNATQGLKVGGTAFPKNWCHKSGSEPLSMTINCKNMIISYKNTDNRSGFGKAEIYVDGKKAACTVGGKKEAALDATSNGWNNIYTALIFNDATAAEHKIEINMVEGDELKSFTICGFGYSK